MGLAEAREAITQRLQIELCVAAAGHPVEEVGESYEAICDAFQGLGICELLLNMDINRFQLNLARSAQARQFFLRKSQEKGSTDTIFVALSRTQSLFDAIACGEPQLARGILHFAPDTWMPDGEYEDEYDYQRFVHAISAARSTQAGANAIDLLDKFEKSANDDMSTRLALCKVFLGGDEQGFWDALSQLLLAEGVRLNDESALEEEFKRRHLGCRAQICLD